MNRRIQLIFLSLSLSLGAISQVRLLHSEMMRLEKHGDVEMIVSFDSPDAIEKIERIGGDIVSSLVDGSVIVRVDASRAGEVANVEGVSGASLSRIKRMLNDQALAASMLPDVKQGVNLPSAFNGEGVVLGVYDIGMDPNHINFRDSDGNSKVKRVWHYKVSGSAVPVEYDTPAKIATFATDNRSESHGTHVMGILAGDFYDSGNSSAPDYRGVAPDAELLVACGDGSEVQILDALKRMGEYALEAGKPCVVNLSFGDNYGPHDGSDEFTSALNRIADKYDILLSLASGNEREKDIALISATDGRNALSTFLLPYANYITSVTGGVQIWSSDARPLNVRLEIVKSDAPGQSLVSFEIPDGNGGYAWAGRKPNVDGDSLVMVEDPMLGNICASSYMGGRKGAGSNGRYFCELNVDLRFGIGAVDDYRVKLTVNGDAGSKVFFYSDYDSSSTPILFGNDGVDGILAPDGAGSNSNMGSGKNTISVGSYVTRTGNGYTGLIGTPSPFSSYGETPDGRFIPDICAPGQAIISSRNSNMYSSTGLYTYRDSRTGKTFGWMSMAGTSMASPHLAGIAALVRQANPRLDYRAVKEILKSTACRMDNGKGWGAGRVDAFAAVRKALESSGVNDISTETCDKILIERSGSTFRITVGGEKSVRVFLYDLGGGIVASGLIDGNGENVVSDCFDVSGIAPGLYILQVEGANTAKSLKVII